MAVGRLRLPFLLRALPFGLIAIDLASSLAIDLQQRLSQRRLSLEDPDLLLPVTRPVRLEGINLLQIVPASSMALDPSAELED